MSRDGAAQLGDAMYAAQDRGSHWEGARFAGHDDVADKLSINGHNTDDPSKNSLGKARADRLSDQVLADYWRFKRGAEKETNPNDPPAGDPADRE